MIKKLKSIIYTTIYRTLLKLICETWTMIVGRVERKTLRKIFGPYQDTERNFRMCTNRELAKLHDSPDIVRDSKGIRNSWAGHLQTNENHRLMKKWKLAPQGRTPLDRPKIRWKYNSLKIYQQ